MWDRTAIETIVGIHISNMRKHGKRVPPQISAPPKARGIASISVIDFGPGVHESDLRRIFAKCPSARHPYSTVAGIGVGSWSAGRFAPLYDGSISLDASAQPGTALVVTTPAGRDAARASRSVG